MLQAQDREDIFELPPVESTSASPTTISNLAGVSREATKSFARGTLEAAPLAPVKRIEMDHFPAA